MKKIFRLLLAIVVFYVVLSWLLPGVIDKKINKLTLLPPYKVSNEAQQLFDSLEFISDLHCDALLWKRNLLKKNNFGSVDIPRLIEGKVTLQAFTIVSKVPYGINFQSNPTSSDMLVPQSIFSGRMPKTWFSPLNRALAQCRELEAFEQKSKGAFTIIRSAQDLKTYLEKKKTNPKITAGFLGLEGLHALEGNIENVDVLYDAGVRMMAPVHFADNEMGGSAHGESKAGLSDFGKKVIKILEDKKIIIDVAHSSPKMLDDIFASSKGPFITSHTGVKGTLNSVRNLSDQHLKAIANSGGLIGIAFFEGAVGGTDAMSTAKAIQYTIHLVGAQHVALGSDYDGAIEAHFDITGLPLLVDAMLQLGISHQDIRLVMGENVKRFWLENL